MSTETLVEKLGKQIERRNFLAKAGTHRVVPIRCRHRQLSLLQSVLQSGGMLELQLHMVLAMLRHQLLPTKKG